MTTVLHDVSGYDPKGEPKPVVAGWGFVIRDWATVRLALHLEAGS